MRSLIIIIKGYVIKKTIHSLIVLASMGLCASSLAQTMTSTGNESLFQWRGTVGPESRSGAGYFIVPEGEIAFHRGEMKLERHHSKSTQYTLSSASKIGFKVLRDEVAGDAQVYDEATDTQALPYQAKLLNINIEVNGTLTEQANNGYFNVVANGRVLTLSSATTPSTNATTVTLKQNTDPAAHNVIKHKGRENMMVYATFAVSDMTI